MERCLATFSAVSGPQYHGDGDSQSELSLYLSALIYKVQGGSELSVSVTSQAYRDLGQIKRVALVNGIAGFVCPLQRVFSLKELKQPLYANEFPCYRPTL